jgi:hypothetical protein
MTNDSISEAIDIAFTDSFSEAHEHYRVDHLEECAAKAHKLLEDSAIPTYHRIKTLFLLGLILADMEEANECRVKAEGHWRIVGC